MEWTSVMNSGTLNDEHWIYVPFGVNSMKNHLQVDWKLGFFRRMVPFDFKFGGEFFDALDVTLSPVDGPKDGHSIAVRFESIG